MAVREETGAKQKVVLIDGNSLLYRAFYALPETLATSTGQVTNAVFGFTSMLIKLLETEGWDTVIVAFDRGKTFRHEVYEDYKANRKPPPDTLQQQKPIAREVLGALAIPTVEAEGFEADDLLATLAKRGEEAGHKVLVVTGDRDAFQLISPQVSVLTTRRGITDIVRYDPKRLDERYGIPPNLIRDMLALKGDESDNIPGAPGIGEKTALKLVKEFGTVEELFERLQEVTPPRIRQILEDHKDLIVLGKELATLHYEVPLDIDLQQAAWAGYDEAKVREVFGALEFRTLMERLFALETGAPPAAQEESFTYRELAEEDLDQLTGAGEAAAVPHFDRGLEGVALATGEGLFYIPAGLGGLFQAERPLAVFLGSERPAKLLGDAKATQVALGTVGLPVGGIAFDLAVAAYLLDPTHTDYSVERLARDELGMILPDDESDPHLACCAQAEAVRRLAELFRDELQSRDQTALFEEIELPLVRVLADMEQRGVAIDQDHLGRLSAQLEADIQRILEEAWAAAGEEFNLNSPQQLSRIIFDKLGLTTRKRRKTSTGTDASILADMAGDHPLIPLILEYRELAKLKSTYLDALPRLVNPETDRLHTSFNQTVTATGRLSSSNPNLQNIPVRTPLGQQIRQAFVPGIEGDLLLVADYSQIELRILAHLSGDPTLTDAFLEGEDIHTRTAAEVFDVDAAEVDTEMRRRAKAVNFGIVYGISPYGLSEQLGIDPDEAERYIALYFSRYPKVQEYIQQAIAQAHRDGFVVTLLGRRRYLPEMKSSVYRVRSFGERLAVNTPIQGSAADLMKKAMVDLHQRVLDAEMGSRMVLQVHDELVLEIPPEEQQLARDLVREAMVGVYPLHPPLVVNIAAGKNWAEAK